MRFNFFPPPPADPTEQRNLLISHIQALKNRPEFRLSSVVLGVESNLGFEADHHEAYIVDERMQHFVCVLHESTRSGRSEKSVGLQATNARKAQMAFLVRYDLQNKRYRIADTVTCLSGPAHAKLAELREQLMVFCRMVEPAPRVGGKPRIVYTGKHARSNDDMAIAFQWGKIADMYFNSGAGRVAYAPWHRGE